MIDRCICFSSFYFSADFINLLPMNRRSRKKWQFLKKLMNGITVTRENLISGNVIPILSSFVFYCCRYVRFALTAQRRFNWPSINGVALPPTPITIAELSRHFYEVIERQQRVNTFRAV